MLVPLIDRNMYRWLEPLPTSRA